MDGLSRRVRVQIAVPSGQQEKAADAQYRLCVGENQRGDPEDEVELVCNSQIQAVDVLDLDSHLKDIAKYLREVEMIELDSRQRRLNCCSAKTVPDARWKHLPPNDCRLARYSFSKRS